MARVSASLLFRAEATRLPWAQIGYRALRTDQHVDVKWADEMKRRTAGRDQDVHVWWACAAALGVPRGPFTVWVGNPSTKRVKEVPPRHVPAARVADPRYERWPARPPVGLPGRTRPRTAR